MAVRGDGRPSYYVRYSKYIPIVFLILVVNSYFFLFFRGMNSYFLDHSYYLTPCCLFVWFITVRKQSLRRLCFYTCLSFCPQGGGVGSLGPYPGGGEVGGSGWGGGLQAHTRAERVEGSGQGGRQAQAWGVQDQVWEGCVSQHALRQTPQQTATAADGTHPTGMHSCFPQQTLTLSETHIFCF